MIVDVDLDVDPLTTESIEKITEYSSVPSTSLEILTRIDTFATLRGKKTHHSRDPLSYLERTRRVVVIHYDGRERPVLYGIKYIPYMTKISEFSKNLGDVVGLEDNERLILGWASLQTDRTVCGTIIDDDDVMVPRDDSVHFVLTAWRVPISETYYVYSCLLSDEGQSMAPPIFLDSFDLQKVACALRPFLDVNPILYETLMVDVFTLVSQQPLRGTSYKRVTVVLDDHIRENGVPVYRDGALYKIHESASYMALHDEWKREGRRAAHQKIIEESSASRIRDTLRREHTSCVFKLRVLDHTTLRLEVTSAARYSPILPYVSDDSNRERWCTAIHINRQIPWSYDTLLSLLETSDDAPCATQPPALRIPLYRHQLQNLYKMSHLEERTTVSSTIMTRCSDDVWLDPRLDLLYPHSTTRPVSGGFLCDTVGLGKTLSVIALCTTRPPPRAGTHNTLIICPPSILVQWRREIEKHSSLRVLEYHGKKKQGVDGDMMTGYDVILTTYTTYMMSDVFTPLRWHRVVYDESHTMGERISRHHPVGNNVWCVTATPFHNIERQFRVLSIPRYSEGFPALYYILEPLMSRHTQRQSSQLPECTIEDVAVEFETKYEETLYTQTHTHIAASIDTMDAFQLHANITTLRRLCTCGAWDPDSLTTLPTPPIAIVPDPTLIAPHDDDDMCPICMNIYEQPAVTTCNHWFCADCIGTALAIPPGKCPMCRATQRIHDIRYGVLHDYVPETHQDTPMDDPISCDSKINKMLAMIVSMDPTSKAIVFCESSTMIPYIMGLLRERGIVSRCIHGSMPAIQRGNAIKAFQEDTKTTVFVSSLRSAAAGINLTAANTIFFLGPVMNDANYVQAIGRAHRTGQTRDVKVYRLYMKGTIEEKLLLRRDHWTLDSLRMLFVM
jgi:hypothetical protein